jgi:hypothetical protein
MSGAGDVTLAASPPAHISCSSDFELFVLEQIA